MRAGQGGSDDEGRPDLIGWNGRTIHGMPDEEETGTEGMPDLFFREEQSNSSADK